MVSSNRRILASILLCLAVASSAYAQANSPKGETASISGRVTFKNKGIAGIVVVAVETESSGGWQRSRLRGTTDEAGNYRINDIPAGSYYAYPLSPALVADGGASRKLLVVSRGETISDVNFALVRGGVITGKVVNADQQPLVEQIVSVTPIDLPIDNLPPTFQGVQTDDRGVYRAFGLRPGKYRVSVGQSLRSLPGQSSQIYRQTFYPSVTDSEKATILEVNESSEIQNIDIVTGPPVSTLKVTGRIIDGETGKPLPNVSFSVHLTEDGMTVSASGGMGSNKDGEFRLENALPGRYTLNAVLSDKSDWRAEPVTFDVVDRDVTGLEMKAKRGASLSGVVVLQNYDEKSAAAKLSEFEIFAFIENPSMQYSGARSTRVEPDGSFKISGLVAGSAQLAISMSDRTQSRQFQIASVEQNGVPQTGEINLKDGEQISGLRVVVKNNRFTGAIRGQVKLESGEPPPSPQIIVSVIFMDENPSKSQIGISVPSPQVDSRGRFLLEHLATGTYEIIVTIYQPGPRATYDVARQQVTVTDYAVSEVTLTVKPKP